MKIQQFLDHHGIVANPFSEEDAQTDHVFKDHCIERTYHPSWDKIYGDPADPSTSIVFGEKGAGKTALRLQIVRHLEEHNRRTPDRRTFIVEYDDFNRFLDHFRDRLGPRRRRADRVLTEWKLWDHMDAILSIAVTGLVNQVIATPTAASQPAKESSVQDRLRQLDRWQARDLLLLAACYDQSTSETFVRRWQRLRRKLRYRNWRAQWALVCGILVTAAVAALIGSQQRWDWLGTPWPYLAVVAGWLPWMYRSLRAARRAWRVGRQVRTLHREVNSLRKVFARFNAGDLADQPLPEHERTDDRYELLAKLQGVLRTLGYTGIVVLVDRVDEPHLINGSADQMRALLWPMLDNKFLKHPGVGFKLLLPIELARFIDREERDFYQRARLDKQNLIPSLIWTGEALYDVANDRLRACAANGKSPALRDLLDESVSDQRMLEALRGLRVPRHMFKFLYRLMVAHTSAHTDDKPAWKIGSATFESTLALYQREADAFDRGIGPG